MRCATSSRSTTACSGVPLRANVSRLATIRPARSACSWMTPRCSRASAGTRSCSSSSSDSPAIEVSGLFSSCATPDTSWPTAAIFSFWISWASSARWSVTSSTITTTDAVPSCAGRGAPASRSVRCSLADGNRVGIRDCPSRAPAISASAASDSENSEATNGLPTSDARGTPASSASARLARVIRPAPSTSAIPSERASKVVSHSSLPWRRRPKNRLLVSTTAACMATVEISHRSWVEKGRSRRAATAMAPSVIPWARSGATAVRWTRTPATSSTPGAGPSASSMRSRPIAWVRRPPSADGMERPSRAARVPSAAAIRNSGCSSEASATTVPSASRKREVKRATCSTIRSVWSDSERT